VHEIVVVTDRTVLGGDHAAFGRSDQLRVRVAHVLAGQPAGAELVEYGVAGQTEVDGRAAGILESRSRIRAWCHGGEEYRPDARR